MILWENLRRVEVITLGQVLPQPIARLPPATTIFKWGSVLEFHDDLAIGDAVTFPRVHLIESLLVLLCQKCCKITMKNYSNEAIRFLQS